jgi:hypothetical protein
MTVGQQMIIHFSMDMGMPIATNGQTSSHKRESHQPLRGEKILFKGRRI